MSVKKFNTLENSDCVHSLHAKTLCVFGVLEIPDFYDFSMEKAIGIFGVLKNTPRALARGFLTCWKLKGKKFRYLGFSQKMITAHLIDRVIS